ncbi:MULTISPECIES: LTA synthase family protein [unclassified Fusibacter]|uniref:LTA synthase family protein n=1 Tax=unclassified Fusibacter TaxID=2624464 RepID=UPI001010F9FF|nr:MULTISPECIES: LTA synthase family protein [unclassified Fusibacter]MCK8059147.1 LTA synthase family protein [Fusibacter sp. A2]NPE22556.1 LTA synthase family protein [Fusibacter sp. A1]RXV60659.1 LTA synthase family protein [Fusibacter sp. A1]
MLKDRIISELDNRFKAIRIFFGKLSRKPMKQMVVLSIAVYFILETLSSRSPLEGMLSVVDNPLMSIQNTLIIFLTLSVANFISRRNFIVLLISVSWILLGFSNFLLLGYRTTPLTAADIGILKSVFDIISVYMNPIQVGLVVLLVIAVFISMIYAFFKIGKTKVQFKNAIIVFCCTLAMLSAVNTLSFRTNSLTDNFTNIAQAFQDYGFAYCFSISLIDRGIDEPKTYSQEVIEDVLEDIEYPIKSEEDYVHEVVLLKDNEINPFLYVIDSSEDKKNDGRKPNIVMVQLESFFDVNHLKDFSFSEDPTPIFNQLKKDHSSGFLTVPSIGAGTANTEFEVLTGMSLNFFGAGEYPYKTILKEKSVESIAFNLEEQGYRSHAIHNNTGTFYSRHYVYPNLGFDSFSSVEYMRDYELNPLGWVKDKVITPEIIKALKATEEQDFVFAVSVQPHGKYPSEVVDENQRITVTADLEEDKLIGYEYFVNQLHETDQFIGDLTQQLMKYPEPVVLVLYGDHLPTMGIEDEDLTNLNKFQTEYVIWSNFDINKMDKNLMAYQLNAYVMERLGYDNGVLSKFHQMNATAEDYMDTFLLLQYDMLYGQMNVYGGFSPHHRKSMKMGLAPIELTSISVRGETVFIHGNNFTKASAVFMDGEIQETWYVDKNTLILPFEITDVHSKLFVAQVTPKEYKLSKSKEIEIMDLFVIR